MTSVTELLDIIKARSKGQKRYLVAIAGPPGSGKSTLADTLAKRLESTAAVLPMDGFHLDNERLRAMGLLARKGAPETFDARAFIDLVRLVRSSPSISFPTFDRQADRALPDAGKITSDHRIILIEGNYLLLDTPPWSELADLFDLTIGLNVPREVLKRRLTQRWLDHGLPEGEAIARAHGNDLKNADTVAQNAREPEFSFQNID